MSNLISNLVLGFFLTQILGGHIITSTIKSGKYRETSPTHMQWKSDPVKFLRVGKYAYVFGMVGTVITCLIKLA